MNCSRSASLSSAVSALVQLAHVGRQQSQPRRRLAPAAEPSEPVEDEPTDRPSSCAFISRQGPGGIGARGGTAAALAGTGATAGSRERGDRGWSLGLGAGDGGLGMAGWGAGRRGDAETGAGSGKTLEKAGV